MVLDKDKIKLIYKVMKEENIDYWLIVGRESLMKSEPILKVLGDVEFTIATAFLFTQENMIAFVSPLDTQIFKDLEGINQVITYETTLSDVLTAYFVQHQEGVLALNYSKNDAASDGLTYGLKRMIEGVLKKAEFKGDIVSAFSIIKKARGIKTATQIEKITHAAIVAHDYLMQVPQMLYEGVGSLDIFNYLQSVAAADGYTMSWAASQCPGVSVDPNVPSGHMGIIATPVVKGCFINIDYGVAKDGYCSDLQRMYYVLKDDEEVPPKAAIDAFNTVRDAIQQTFEALKPGVTGYEMDKIARSHVVSEGYDSWNAALGHQVGHVTHDGGTILANRRARYNRPELIDTPLDAGNVFTIEPSVETPYGRVGIEEMVVIEATGARWLVPPQQALIVVRLKKEEMK